MALNDYFHIDRKTKPHEDYKYITYIYTYSMLQPIIG